MKVFVRRIRLDCQGYDRFGYYYGIGGPVYEYEHFADDDCADYICGAIRAYDRNEAKEKIRELYPTAGFYR